MEEEIKKVEIEKVYTESEVEKIRKKERKSIFIPGLIAIMFLFLSNLVTMHLLWANVKDILGSQDMQKLLSVIELYNKNYNKELDMKTAIDYSISGLVLASEDKYGGYIPSDKARTTGNKIKQGSYVGLGITYTIYDSYLEITRIEENSAAGRSEMEVGDKVIEIDNQAVNSEVVDNFRKDMAENKDAKHIFKTDTGKEIELEADLVDFPKVDFFVENNVGFIQIYTFVEDTVELFKEALLAVKEENVTEIIFDLRDNSGGDVGAVTKMLDMLVDEGLIVELDYYTGKQESVYATKDVIINTNIPLKIVVNSSTASASELFTMCLQDLRNAKVYGRQTFGKSTILSYFSFKDGSILVMSTGIYYPQSRRIIEDEGIEPDIVLKRREISLSLLELYEKDLLE